MKDYNNYCKKVLFKNFPELLETLSYKKAVKYGDDESAGIIYERIFVSYILQLIKDGDSKNKKKISKAFKMIENLLQHNDFNVRCVAEVEFIEPFLVKLKPTKDVEKYLMPKSLAVARELARRWFKINPNNWEATS